MQLVEAGIAAVGSVSLRRELRGAGEEHSTTAAAARRSTRLTLLGECARTASVHSGTGNIFYSLLLAPAFNLTRVCMPVCQCCASIPRIEQVHLQLMWAQCRLCRYEEDNHVQISPSDIFKHLLTNERSERRAVLRPNSKLSPG